MSVIERGIIDRFFNGYLLKKREIWKPFKYVNSVPFRYNKHLESIIYPRNKFEQIYADLVESMLPSIQYFFYNDLSDTARKEGFTVQEKLHNNFFRTRNIYFHAMGQSLHPWGYTDRQRADQYYRRVDTILPGIEMPEYGRQQNRSPNYDFESVYNTFAAYRQVYEEATPKPHFGHCNYFVLQHLANQRYQIGYWAQRLFYNEKPKGNTVYNNGKTTKEDLEMMNSWYGSCRFNTQERLSLMSSDEKERFKQRHEKWNNLIDTYYPDFKALTPTPSNHKYDEPNYERNMDDIRDSLFMVKCQEKFESGVFSQTEIQQLVEYFIGDAESEANLFVVSPEDGLFQGTELYHKFTKEFNLPDIFQIQHVTARPPEQTFLDRLDRNWGISYNAVNTHRRLLTKLTSSFNADEFDESVKNREREVRSLISEEIFNILFRQSVQSSFGVSASLENGESAVVAALKKNNNAFDQLYSIQEQSRAAYPLANRQVRNHFLQRIRGYLKGRPFNVDLSL